MTFRRIVPLAFLLTAGSVAFFPTETDAAQNECVSTRKEVSHAEKSLEKATKNADKYQKLLDRCKAKSDSCDKTQAAYDDAMSAKREAESGMKSAAKILKNVCRIECAAAKIKENDTGRALTEATREADGAQSDYEDCRDKGGKCSPEKHAAAISKKAKARATRAHSKATKMRDTMCPRGADGAEASHSGGAHDGAAAPAGSGGAPAGSASGHH
jgi:cysteinyl-tRNA synthetase